MDGVLDLTEGADGGRGLTVLCLSALMVPQAAAGRITSE